MTCPDCGGPNPSRSTTCAKCRHRDSQRRYLARLTGPEAKVIRVAPHPCQGCVNWVDETRPGGCVPGCRLSAARVCQPFGAAILRRDGAA